MLGGKGGDSVERNNNLSKNLRAFQQARSQSLAEFSRTLGIPKSTLQSVMLDGNTTLDTLIHLADALNLTLDQLVFGADIHEKLNFTRCLLSGAAWFSGLPPALQKKLHLYIDEILDLIENNND